MLVTPVSARLQGLLEAPPFRRLTPVLTWWLTALFGEAAAARDDAAFLARPDGDSLALVDRRGAEPRVYRLALGSEDLGDRLAAICGSERARRGVKVLIDPAACFIRTLTLPAQVLPRMRDVLAQELEAATPFKADGVHADWYVEGEDGQGRLRVRHVIVKRATLDPLLATLAGAGLVPRLVAVGRQEDKVMPVDLLTGGRRRLPPWLRRFRPADAVLLVAALGLAMAAVAGWGAHQDATLAALEQRLSEARRAAAAGLPPPVQAGLQALVAARGAHPPVAAIWSALAALPPAFSAETLHVDAAGAQLTLLAPDAAQATTALTALPLFAPPLILATAEAPGGGRRLTVLLHWAPPPP